MVVSSYLIGRKTSDLDTPALLVDLDVLEANIQHIAGTCAVGGVAWRPHVKAQKTPAIAHMALAAGAIGVTCAKLGEAEVMAQAGICDILIANQIVTRQKIQRLVALRRHADVIASVDNPDNIDALSHAAAESGITLRVVVEVNIGIDRAGVDDAKNAVILAQRINSSEGLSFSGVMGWEGHTTEIVDQDEKRVAIEAAVGKLVEVANACASAGFPTPIVSCGGTGTFRHTSTLSGVTEIQAGGGVFSDVRYRTKYRVDLPYALTILSTVISRPNPNRIVCDAGKKTMTSDTAVPVPLGLNEGASVSLSAEHARIELDQPEVGFRVGDQIEFIVGYSDTTVNLHDEMYGVRNGRVETVWPLLARGRTR